MAADPAIGEAARPCTVAKRVALGVTGLAIGGLFLHLALRNLSRQDFDAALAQFDWPWLAGGVAVYIASVAVRCLRWGLLLRANAPVKWPHIAEALLAGYAANYLLPARIGELFRADYARRLFQMDRFTALGTIFVERVCDGIILVSALWIGLGILSLTSAATYPSWAIAAGVTASVAFGLALLFALLSGRIDLSKFGLPDFIAARWERLKQGIASIARGQMGAVILLSIGIWILEVTALACIARAFAVALSVPQAVVMLVLGSLSTLIPTAPGFLGTFQFVFGQVFAWFGYPASLGVVVSTTLQVFCFGTVTVIGVAVLLLRSGLAVFSALKPRAGDVPRSE